MDEEKILDPTAKIEINLDTYKWATIAIVKRMLEVNQLPNHEELGETFTQHYESLLQAHAHEDLTDLARYYRLITAFKPALSKILKLGKEQDQICDYAVQQFNVALNRIRRQLEENRPARKKGPILPGSNSSILLKYFCKACNQEFEIPPEKQAEILSSEEKMALPAHCGQEMEIRMSRVKEERVAPEEKAKKIKKITIYPAELLMGHADSAEANVEYLKLLSVGIDIGSSTSHLVFSRLTLRRETGFFNLTNRFLLVERDLIYEGNIIFTPLIDSTTIDIEAIITFCEAEYEKAGITPVMVDTGAVIVTGETAKKQNAAEIVRRLSSESGKFVSASAGPNFESLLGAMGSGSVHQSLQLQNTILNADVGGGTSNLAISSKGDVLSCACINVGGRLLGIDKDFKIWRIDGPTEVLMKELKMDYQLGDIIPEEDARLIAQTYATALIEVLQGPATNIIAKELMMTADLDYSTSIDGFSFSGGIGEFIYGTGKESHESTTYNDIGHYLAEEIVVLMKEHNLPLIEPENKIRATVIGAGAFSLSISGSTCYIDEGFALPLDNIPVIPVNLTRDNFSPEKVIEEVKRSYAKFDMEEGTDVVGLFFKDAIYPNEKLLSIFATSLEQALPNSVAQNKPIILLFQGDLAKLLGLTIHRETTIKSNLLCLDELILEAGDWIDIGASLHEPPRQVFPVTVKSLVFNQDKKNG